MLMVTGNVINIQTGKWEGHMSGLGAGIDSYYEYLFKVCTVSVLYIKFESMKYIFVLCIKLESNYIISVGLF